MTFKNQKFFVTGLLLLLGVSGTLAANRYVRKSGNDSNNGLTPATAWKTVSKAAAFALTAGDTVFIGSGTYNEQLIPSYSGTSGHPIVYYGDYLGLKTTDPAAPVRIGGCCGVSEFEPKSASQNNFTFTLQNIVDNQNGTTTITIRVRNDNRKALSYVIFSLPSGATALSPEDGSTYVGEEGISYAVENITCNPFCGLKFNTIGEGIVSGADDIFVYTLRTEDVVGMNGAANIKSEPALQPAQCGYTAITMEAKASNITGRVTISVDFGGSCFDPDEACRIIGKNNLTLWGITFSCANNAGAYLSGASNIVIEDCNTENTQHYGIYVTGQSGFLTMLTDTITGGIAAGIYVTSSNANIVLNIQHNFINHSGNGIELNSSKAQQIDYNVIDSVCTNGIKIQSGNPVVSLSHNTVSNTDGYGIYAYLTNVTDFNHNHVFNTVQHGIYINGNNHTVNSFAFNEVHGQLSAAQCGVYADKTNFPRVANNLIYNTTNHGLYIYSRSTYSLGRVDSNMVSNCPASGIYLRYPLNMTSLSYNTVYLCATAINHYATSAYRTVDRFAHNRVFSYSTAGIYTRYLQNSTLENNLVYGATNSKAYGIEIYNAASKTVNVKNNTVYQGGKYGIYGRYVTGSWRNNIVQSCTYGLYSTTKNTITDSYNCIYGCTTARYRITAGTGSIAVDPKLVDPDGLDDVLGGNNWLDDDLHEKGGGGSYHFGQWLEDDEDSPCVDTGKPEDDYSNEPEDNGARINMGCYGNTAQASKKRRCPITAVYPNFPSGKWVMIGVPIEPWEGTPQGDPFALFADDFDNRMPDGHNWFCIHWVCEDSVEEYYEYGDGTIYQPPTPYPGIGYFIWQGMGAPRNVDVLGCPIRTCTLTVAQAPYVEWSSRHGTALGFNQFANPFYFTIDWSNTEVLKYSERYGGTVTKHTLAEAASQGWISQYAYTYNHNADQYEVVVPNAQGHADSLSVWQAFYFVQIDSVTNLKLNIPYRRALFKPAPTEVEPLAKLGEKYNYRTASISPAWDWFLKMGVVSADYKLQDIENGIGVCAAARDGFDGWDAFELRGTSAQGDYVQLEFVNSDNRVCAYDLHNRFEQSSSWQMRINTNPWNIKKKLHIVWPQIRLVPQNVKFSLLDSDNSKVLVDDLRQVNSYTFTIPDSSKIFYVRATKVADTAAPQFAFAFAQNPLMPTDLTYYIVPSEPLAALDVTLNGTAVNLNSLASPPEIYYGKKLLTGSGSLTLNISASDADGNTGSSSATLQYQLLKANQATRLSYNKNEATLEIPAGAIDESRTIFITRCAMEVGLLNDYEPVGNPILIGPDNLTFRKRVKLHIATDPQAPATALYKYTNGQWRYVAPYSEDIAIESSGIYQLFTGNFTPGEPTSVPHQFALYECYPNPFNGTTVLRYAVERWGKVNLLIYDLLGREVRQLVSGYQQPGFYQLSWDGKNNAGEQVASGVYYLKLQVLDGDAIQYQNSRKLTLIK